MSTRNKKITPTDSYFERTRRNQHPKKYRCYFFDYLYYCGELLGKKNFRMSGGMLLFVYWVFCIATPLCLYLSQLLEFDSLFTNCEELAIFFAILLSIWPFCFFRYRKERVMAIKRHYRQQGWRKPSWLVYFVPIIIVLLEVAVLKLW